MPEGARYTIESLLGRGAMGEAFLARQSGLGRRVVLKCMLPETASDHELVLRFRREAFAAARIDSDHVVKVFDTGSAAGRPFIALEYVEGESLADLVARTPRLELRTIAAVAVATARALRAVHAAGVVHRDVKPANILVGRDGRVKLTDFGLAKLIDEPSAANAQELTAPGTVVGTPAYIAPEQASGEPVDGRADVYALGVTLYELLGGVLPFVGSSRLETLALRLRKDPRPLGEVAPSVPASFVAVCEKLMAREVADRPTAAEAVRLLEALAATDWTEKTEPPVEPKKRSRITSVRRALVRPEEPKRRGALIASVIGLLATAAVLCVSVLGH